MKKTKTNEVDLINFQQFIYISRYPLVVSNLLEMRRCRYSDAMISTYFTFAIYFSRDELQIDITIVAYRAY